MADQVKPILELDVQNLVTIPSCYPRIQKTPKRQPKMTPGWILEIGDPLVDHIKPNVSLCKAVVAQVGRLSGRPWISTCIPNSGSNKARGSKTLSLGRRIPQGSFGAEVDTEARHDARSLAVRWATIRTPVCMWFLAVPQEAPRTDFGDSGRAAHNVWGTWTGICITHM